MLFDKFGLTHHNADKALQGYTLYSPINHDEAFLLNMEGEIVHKWQLSKSGGINHCMLLPNGNLFISEGTTEGPTVPAGKAGTMTEYDWDGNIVWQHHDKFQHHDARRLKNGNTLYIAWKQLDPAIMATIKGGRAGTEQDFDPDGPWQDILREIDPEGNVVWEWESLNLDIEKYEICPLCRRHEWAHANTCFEMPDGNFMMSYRVLNLLIVIDRKSGEIVWEHYDPELGHQHDCHLLENGNVLVYRNGWHAHDSMHSSILEFDFETREPVWEYSGNPKLSFLSPHISGTQRLDNGNTLICEGGKGCIFEVTMDGEIVWQYVSDIWTPNPIMGDVNWVFRAYRYSADSPQIQNRV